MCACVGAKRKAGKKLSSCAYTMGFRNVHSVWSSQCIYPTKWNVFKRGVNPWSLHSACSGCHTVLTVAVCGVSELRPRVICSLLYSPLHSRLYTLPSLSVAVCVGLLAWTWNPYSQTSYGLSELNLHLQGKYIFQQMHFVMQYTFIHKNYVLWHNTAIFW